MAKAGKKVDVFKEMSLLGKQVHAALEAAAQSKEVRGIKTELGKSLRVVSEKMGEAVQAAKQSERGRVIGTQVKKVISAGKVQGIEASKELKKHLVSGLRELSEHLSKAAEKMKNR
ncbi:MAG: hypothetical protein HY922_16760 [Elusimicrobia bacterium]|nr:hypothetical protein [Elusimicrobiota bacterium]